jgi:putative transposase
VWNRAAGRLRLFKKDADFLAFERTLIEAHHRLPMRLLDWCLMPNHWHFVVWPREDGQVTDFFRWLTLTHAVRAITHRGVTGMGPLYQGRFKALPVQEDAHLLTLQAYVQRNPVRAKLAKRAASWRWGSEGVRHAGIKELATLLTEGPVHRPRNWSQRVDQVPPVEQGETIRECIRRSRPFGTPSWTARIADKLDLAWTIRPRGRPAGRSPNDK